MTVTIFIFYVGPSNQIHVKNFMKTINTHTNVTYTKQVPLALENIKSLCNEVSGARIAPVNREISSKFS